MRPKKVVLLVNGNEKELSVLKFVLETNGYRVFIATNPPEAVDMFNDNLIGLVLVYFEMPVVNSVRLTEKLKRMKSSVPVILLGNPEEMSNVHHPADAVVSKRIPSKELLVWVKHASERKRGPRKKAAIEAPMEPPPMSSQLATETT